MIRPLDPPRTPVSSEHAAIYDVMRGSELNEWVGGGDPEVAGEISASIVARHIPSYGETRLLDFGCGIGRVALGVLRHMPGRVQVTGFDIVPRLVDFCNAEIASHYDNVNFELVADQNAHYERYKSEAVARSRDELLGRYASSFDAAYAFSVFTHVDAGDFVDHLRFLSALVKPGGRVMFTAFALSAFARQQIEAGRTQPPFSNARYEENGEVFVGNTDDRLAFIAYDVKRLDAMMWDAGLIPWAAEYGMWRGDEMSFSYQDLFVCRRPLA